MFNTDSKKRSDLLSIYIIYFKVSFYKSPTFAEENLDLLFSVLNEIQEVSEWNRSLSTFAEAWKTVAPKSNGIVDIVQTKVNILKAIKRHNLSEKAEYDLIKDAENNVDKLYDNEL